MYCTYVDILPDCETETLYDCGVLRMLVLTQLVWDVHASVIGETSIITPSSSHVLSLHCIEFLNGC